MARSLNNSIRWDGQLRLLSQRLSEIFSRSDADPVVVEKLASEGRLDELAFELGNTTPDELVFLFTEIRKKAERLAERYPELGSD